ncbi:MAG: Hsp20/alpha crystallin family protein [Desulfomonile tiedjei]|nr:Hsp20/alpha crystallin family protein [Desulfomonile tiedjei]
MSNQELQTTEKKELDTPTAEFTREGVYFSPAVDIYDSETELVLLADMPGVSPDRVEIDLRENMLTIVGKVAEETGDFQPLLTEYRSGNYFRTFRISEIVDQSKITASVADGVLKLVLPKVQKAVPRKITISAG